MNETVIETDFIQWFINNEHGVLNTTKLHVASAAWSAGYQAAQQSVQSDGAKSVPAVDFTDHIGCPVCGALLNLPRR